MVTPWGPLTPALGGLFPDVAMEYYGQNNWTAGQSHLRDMAKQRLTSGITADKWNEVVADARLVLPVLRTHPEHVVLAFVYPKSSADFKVIAHNFADNYEKHFGVRVPVILANDVDGSPAGPFVADNAIGIIV